MGKYDKVSIDRVILEGGSYMDKFPKLSVIKSCRIMSQNSDHQDINLAGDENEEEDVDGDVEQEFYAPGIPIKKVHVEL